MTSDKVAQALEFMLIIVPIVIEAHETGIDWPRSPNGNIIINWSRS